MQNKLQELTEKIYQEGLNRGNEEADKIIGNAKVEAEKIIADAKKEQKKILEEAEKKSRELKDNAESELKLSARQALNSLKQQIAGLVTSQLVNAPVKKAFDDPDYIKNILVTVINNWNTKGKGDFDITVLLPADQEKEFQAYFKAKGKELLDKGVTVGYNEKLKSGFEIGPKDGSYKISFTDEVFESFLKDYLRPKLIELIFAGG